MLLFRIKASWSILWLAGLVHASTAAIAAPLDVSSFTSFGAFPSLRGTYTFNIGLRSPTLVGPAGTFTGVVSNQRALFAFDSVDVLDGMTLLGATGSRGIALHSMTTLNVDGLIDVSGGNGLSGPSGASRS
jgi:hypothetical protein